MASESDKQQLDRLFSLAAKNLNHSNNISEDEILELCKKAELQLRHKKDYLNLLKVQQIAVNAYCLKGDMGFAVTKARNMYKEANRIGNSSGIVMAVQAIGMTYMHTNQYKQAHATFLEAEKLIQNTNDDQSKVSLMFQQIEVCLKLNQQKEMQHYLLEVRRLLDRADIPNKKDYAFYIQCYQTLFFINSKDAEQAWESLKQLEQIKPANGMFDRWYYNASFLYYELIGDYKKALVYNDSALETLKKTGNLNEYKNMMLGKAALLSQEGQKKEACLIYERINFLDDSLNNNAYTRQIDSLRVVYWVDQMELENSSSFNKLLAWIMVGGITVLGVAVFLLRVAKKRNYKLIVSRKKLEEIKQEAVDSIYSKSLFLSNMSHEIRTPLNAIVGFSGLLTSNEVIDPETRQQCSDLIKQNSELLLKLINDVADLSALNNKEFKFTYVKCDVVALCRNVIDTVEKVKRTSAELRFSSELKTMEIATDAERLQQVLINLLVNATKFTTEGTITLVLKMDDSKPDLIFAVEDTGCGIPLDKQPTIFNRFEKLHEGIQGAGLGLSICQLIIEHLGGKIWIDPDYSEGARFIFTHPFSKEEKNK